jgi:hypothetical protein
VTVQTVGSWVAIGTSAPGASSMSWTVPGVAGTDYCVRITGRASGFTDASSQGGVFSVLGSGSLIFADDFETGDHSQWSGVQP